MPYTSHQDTATLVEANARYEVHTAKSGTESDTGAFEYPGEDSKLLDFSAAKKKGGDLRKVKYDGETVGTLRTVTFGQDGVGSKTTLVKMHLVNSYLHPKANEWGSNWFWGSHGLNKVHNKFEEAAKKLHPTVSIPSVLLKYETAVGESRPKTPSLAQFTKAVVDKMTSIRDNALRSESADALQPGRIRIGSDTIAKFHSKWVATIGVHAYSSLCVKYQYAKAAESGGLNWSIQVVSPPGESKIIDEQYLPDINAASSQDFWLGMFPVMEPRKRQKVTKT